MRECVSARVRRCVCACDVTRRRRHHAGSPARAMEHSAAALRRGRGVLSALEPAVHGVCRGADLHVDLGRGGSVVAPSSSRRTNDRSCLLVSASLSLATVTYVPQRDPSALKDLPFVLDDAVHSFIASCVYVCVYDGDERRRRMVVARQTTTMKTTTLAAGPVRTTKMRLNLVAKVGCRCLLYTSPSPRDRG